MRELMRRPAREQGPTENRRQTLHKIKSTFILLLTLFSLVVTPEMASAQVVVVPPTFSQIRGFYTNSFNLTLTAPAGTIRYTLNGDIPTASSTQYSGAIPISTTTVVRAAVFSGANRSVVVTNLYLPGGCENAVEHAGRRLADHLC
jgi:hypothetical protein